MKKIMLVFGTRPEGIKMCPLVNELKRRPQVQTVVCVTGQHKQMLQQVLDAFSVVPDYDLAIMQPNQTLFDVTTAILTRIQAVLNQEKPDLTLVHGDTSTAFVTALACFYLHIPVGHVEAGLRTYNLESPFPEEFNRQAVSLICRYHFAPTEKAKQNLLREGKDESSIFVTGNTSIDALKTTVRADYTHPELTWAQGSRLILITAHRRENLGEAMHHMFRAIRRVLTEHPDVKALYPIHLNPVVRQEAAEELSVRLEAIGNIHSDGRPILGLDSRDLLELTLDTCPDAEFIPAHIWTPHFALFGAFSGFDTMEECFGDLTGHIHAVETGLSSDPPMNWRVSALDGLTLVSHSDAHSPSKLGREADLLDTGLTYPELVRAIRTGEGFQGTVEFFPEEGKYHLDGHRNCGVCLTPAETAALGGVCPVCGKKLTIGVEHRVEALADRPAGFRPEGAKPFESLAPLPEVIAASTGVSAAGKNTQALYEQMLHALGPEFSILREVPVEDIAHTAGPCVAEGIRRLRAGQVERRAGFDGEYGVISLLTPGEIARFSGQISLFGLDLPVRKSKPRRELQRVLAPEAKMLH